MRLILSGGQEADVSYGEALLEGFDYEAGVGDKGYDSDKLVRVIEENGAVAVIPPKKNRKDPRWYDRHLYKVRNLVERLIGRVKHFRRVATRYEKKDVNYLAFWHFACITVLLR